MSDVHANSPENEPDEPEIEEAEGQEPEAETEDPEGETPDEPEAESEGDGAESYQEPEPRAARGQPSREQRDRRLSRQEEFDRAVDRAVERRLGQNRPQPAVDFAEQRRQLDARRRQELDEARIQGPEAYADVRDRHLREDYQADTRAREARDQDERDQLRFDRLCDRNQIYNSIRSEVDREIDRLRAQGAGPVQREIVANVLLGRRYAERTARQGSKQRRAAEGETRRQTVRSPSNASSQQPASRRRGARNFADLSVEEMEAQLANIPVRSS